MRSYGSTGTMNPGRLLRQSVFAGCTCDWSGPVAARSSALRTTKGLSTHRWWRFSVWWKCTNRTAISAKHWSLPGSRFDSTSRTSNNLVRHTYGVAHGLLSSAWRRRSRHLKPKMTRDPIGPSGFLRRTLDHAFLCYPQMRFITDTAIVERPEAAELLLASVTPARKRDVVVVLRSD